MEDNIKQETIEHLNQALNLVAQAGGAVNEDARECYLAAATQRIYWALVRVRDSE